MTLSSFNKDELFEKSKNSITFFGSLLYKKRIMGVRVITKGEKKAISGIEFENYGSHSNSYPFLPYFTIACAIGMKKNEIDCLIIKLDQSLVEFRNSFKGEKIINNPSNKEINNKKEEEINKINNEKKENCEESKQNGKFVLI